MQALGNYDSGSLLFLNLGTGVGATVIVDDILVPIEVGSIKLNPKECMADRLSKAALKRDGRKHWSEAVLEAIELLQNVFNPDQTVLGGGNARFVDDLPSNCRCVRQPIRVFRCAALVGKLRPFRQRLSNFMANPS